MRFFDDHTTIYEVARKYRTSGACRLDVSSWLEQTMPALRTAGDEQRVFNECQWLINHRPYYSVYPAIADALMRVPLDLDCSLVKMPLPQLLFRFAEDCPPKYSEYRLRTFLVAEFPNAGQHAGQRVLGLWVRHQSPTGVVMSSGIFPLSTGKPVEWLLSEQPFEEPAFESHRSEFRKMIEPSMRMVVAVCLMQNDPDLICPDVLADDAGRYQQTGDEKFVDRAHRRGKVGWLVGAHLEVDPHYRRAHFGLRWTGPGHSIPRVVPVKGCIVKRNKVSEVPSGYLDDDQGQRAGLVN